MAKFCTQCGAQVDDTAKFCKKCGTRLAPTEPTAHSAPTINYQASNYQSPSNFGPGLGQGAGQPPYQQPYQQPYRGPYQQTASEADLKPNVAGMLCYPLSFITGILFLALTPYNKDHFVKFHAWQSIFFFLALLVLSFALRILPWPLHGLFIVMLQALALIGTGYMMYKAYNGEQFKLPLIGDWAENQASKHTS